MARWRTRVDDLLYDGEDVETDVEVGEGAVVVTSHRVLAFTPESDGANYDYVDRPNVTGVERTNRGTIAYLFHAVKALLVGGVLLAAGQLVSLDGMVDGIELSTAGGAGMGLGGFLSVMQNLLNLLAMLDEIMTLAGAGALLLGALSLGAYALSRETLLVVEVAGDDDVELPAGEDGEDDSVAGRLEKAVRPDDGSEDGDEARDSNREPDPLA
ncbi:hypothetical protein SAMN05216559_0558 [Halomicrobium zhouii]|uniref:Uncharacterized protein n=1 Tax=Halomicrobium zhouii TaxID=767519 RepID=A0A1I6KD56_9EURY|nr:hypothetical protein [Halomicrobium zhouii]SFR88968.1 hypothetical protein SAMN05216559_0558 [Halomicrobium zhouii]